MRQAVAAAVALFVLSVVFQSTFITLDAFVSDEGIVLVAADDVARGRLLYEDCNVPLTPAAYLLQGAVFKLFGSSFLVSRALICILYAGCVCMVFVLALSYLPFRLAVASGALAIPLQVWMWPHAQYFSYNTLSIFLCLVAIRLAWSVETSRHPSRAAIWLGVVFALALWTKVNLAVAAGAGVGLYWVSGLLRRALGLPGGPEASFADRMRCGGLVLAGIVVGSLPMLAYLGLLGILDDAFMSLYAITGIYGDSPGNLFPSLGPPLSQMDAVRTSPDLVLPGMFYKGTDGLALSLGYEHVASLSAWLDLLVRLIYYVPVAFFVWVGVHLGRRLLRRTWSRSDEAALLAFITALLLYLTIIPFPALHYMTPTLLPGVGLVTLVIHRAIESSGARARPFARAASGAMAAAYIVASLTALVVYVSIERAPVETARGTIRVSRLNAEIWDEIRDFTETQLGPEDEVFAVPYFPLFYFMSGRDHPTRYVALGPGLPGVEAEDEIMLELERKKVKYVLYAKGIQYRGLETFENAYPRLHRYLTTRFSVAREFEGRFGTYAQYLKRNEPQGDRR